jgi:membrane-associated phospholipid phosphatase
MTSFDRFLYFMTRPAVILVYLLCVTSSVIFLDKPLAFFLHSIQMRENYIFLTWITHFGLGGIYFILFILMVLYFRFIKHNRFWEIRSWFLLTCLIFSSIICTFLKILFSRARPDLFFSEHAYGFYGLHFHAEYWSFPSGHTTTVMTVVLGLAALFPRYLVPFLITGLIISSSRIFLYHHYLSDVLVAAYLVLLEVGLVQILFRNKNWLTVPGGRKSHVFS